MREPTHDEMIEGIEKALYKKLSLMDHGDFARRPDIAWPRAFQKAVEAFLEKHKDKVMAMIAENRKVVEDD